MARAKEQGPVSGIYAALLTPRKAGTAEADAAALLDYLDRPVNAGVNGLVLFGSTGEFVHFDVSERARATTLAIRRSRVPVLVNVSHSTMTGAIALADSALRIGAVGLLLMPPYFYRYSDEDIFSFYSYMAKYLDGETPLYLYNLPAFTNPLSYGLIDQLLKVPGIAGIKDSSGDPQLLESLSALRRAREFRWMAGNERLYTSARAFGVDGAISGIAAALPELLVALQQSPPDATLCARLDELLAWVERFTAVVAIREIAIFRNWIQAESGTPLSLETQGRLASSRRWLPDWLPTVLTECRPFMPDSKDRR